jgi:ATP-dependent Clp protease ATP-binding subunit ClpC
VPVLAESLAGATLRTAVFSCGTVSPPFRVGAPKLRRPTTIYFSDRASKAMNIAASEARRFECLHIGTAHILMGVLKGPPGVGMAALTNLKINPDSIRQEIENVIQTAVEDPPDHRSPLTRLSGKLMDCAACEAQLLKQRLVGTEHFLLGMLEVGEGVAANVLPNHGVSLGTLRDEVIKIRNERQSIREAR